MLRKYLLLSNVKQHKNGESREVKRERREWGGFVSCVTGSLS